MKLFLHNLRMIYATRAGRGLRVTHSVHLLSMTVRHVLFSPVYFVGLIAGSIGVVAEAAVRFIDHQGEDGLRWIIKTLGGYRWQSYDIAVRDRIAEEYLVNMELANDASLGGGSIPAGGDNASAN